MISNQKTLQISVVKYRFWWPQLQFCLLTCWQLWWVMTNVDKNLAIMFYKWTFMQTRYQMVTPIHWCQSGNGQTVIQSILHRSVWNIVYISELYIIARWPQYCVFQLVLMWYWMSPVHKNLLRAVNHSTH